jgi:hypothetical protein
VGLQIWDPEEWEASKRDDVILEEVRRALSSVYFLNKLSKAARASLGLRTCEGAGACTTGGGMWPSLETVTLALNNSHSLT